MGRREVQGVRSAGRSYEAISVRSSLRLSEKANYQLR